MDYPVPVAPTWHCMPLGVSGSVASNHSWCHLLPRSNFKNPRFFFTCRQSQQILLQISSTFVPCWPYGTHGRSKLSGQRARPLTGKNRAGTLWGFHVWIPMYCCSNLNITFTKHHSSDGAVGGQGQCIQRDMYKGVWSTTFIVKPLLGFSSQEPKNSRTVQLQLGRLFPKKAGNLQWVSEICIDGWCLKTYLFTQFQKTRLKHLRNLISPCHSPPN